MTLRRALAAVCTVALVVVAFSLPVGPADAAQTVPFAPKFTANANGAILTIGNNLLTCAASAPGCATARAGAVADNNHFTMVNLDADDVAATARSSSSSLDLPEGASVLWAGLYWGARLEAGTGGQGASEAAANQMSLRAPGDAAYRTVAASTAPHDQFGPNGSSRDAYQRFADVTSIVQAAGNGEYWGADVAAATGQDRYAGWALTVVYTAPGMPLRNLSVFDGFDVIARGHPQTIAVSGFQAPQAGAVDAQLSMVAYEGDLSQTGDVARLNTTQLGTAVSLGSNFFDSINSRDSASVTTRTPADRNMLGFDIKNLGASGAIPNGATSARFTFSSNGDTYYPGVLGLAINLYAPDFTASSKTVVNLDGNSTARPGDTLQYTLRYINTGQDPAVGVVSEDPLPPGTTFVPGSLALVDPVTGATTALTDAAGDDRGEVAGRTVRVRLGGGADAATGGTMACTGAGCATDGTSRAAYTFQVTLDDAAGGTTVTNVADLAYRTATTGIAASYTANPASVDVITRADVSVTKELSPDPAAVGALIDGTLTVRNDGPNTARNVVVRDPVPDGWTTASIDAPDGVTCTDGAEIVCALGDVPVGASVVVHVHGSVTPGSRQTSLTNVAYVTTESDDPDPTDNVSSDTIALARTADLAITKTASPASAPAGSAVDYTLTVRNDGASDAQDVVVTDTVDDAGLLALTSVTGTTGGATCAAPRAGSLRCTVATLAPGATATVTVQGVLDSALPAGTTVGNAATVTAGTADPDPSNNRVTAQVTTTAPTADVRVTKTGPPTVVAGQTVQWTVTATNFGPSDATGVTLADDAPPGVTVTGATTSRGTCTTGPSGPPGPPGPAGTTVTCDVGTLVAAGAADGGPQPGAAVTVTVTGTVAPDATGPLVNAATVTTTSTDPVPGNDTATASTAVTTAFDLTVEKSANRTSLPAATPTDVDYVVTVRNHGPSAAHDITVRDLLPLALTYGSWATDAGTCDATHAGTPQSGDPDHGLLTCTLPGPLQPGAAAEIRVHTVAETALEGGPPVVETVTVAAPGEEPTSNNTASWTLAGAPYNDLQLTKDAPETVTAGGTGRYTLTVWNHVPNPGEEQTVALAPTLTDTLPPGVTFAGASIAGTALSCATSGDPATGQDVSCAMPANLAPDEHVAVRLDVAFAADLAPGTALVNTATVVNQPGNPDPAPENNTSHGTSTVVTLADPSVTGLAVTPRDPARTGAGTTWDLTFTVANGGPSVARDVTFRVAVDPDVLASASSLPDALPDDCVLSNGELVCLLDGADLAPGASQDFTFTFSLAGYVAAGLYDGTVHVASSTPDADATNNDATTTFQVTGPRTSVNVTKTTVDAISTADGHDAFVAGSAFTYQITVTVPRDAGVADAQDVRLEDQLPPGFLATLVSTTRGVCTLGGIARVTCRLGTLAAPPGSSEPAVVTVHGFVDVSTEGEQFVNTATVTSSTPGQDGTPTSVQATAAADVVEQADLHLYKTADAAPGDDGMPVFYAGGTVGYTLTAVNAGPSDVEHAAIDDTLPPGLTLDPTASGDPSSTSAACTVTGGTPATGQQVHCTVGALGVGESASLRIVATTAPDDGEPSDVPGGDPYGRVVTNTATVTSQATDPDPDNDSASTDARIERLADPALTSAVSTTTPAAGGQITYTAFTINNGPSSAWDVTGTTTFPPGFVPVSIDVPFNTCTWNQPPPADPASVPWEPFSYVLDCVPIDPSSPFPPGQTTTSVVVMHIPGDTPSGTYAGQSVVRTTTPEATTDNNDTAQAVVVSHVSDTQIIKTLVDPSPMLAGRPVTWRLTVTNAGPSTADDVTISDTVPDGMRYVSAQIEGGAACPPPESHDTGVGDTDTVLRCPVGTLAVGQQASALVTFEIDADRAGQDLCNAALVGSGSLDPYATDNQDEACGTAEPPPSADVALTLTPPDQTLRSGDHATLTMTVRNNGPGHATGVTATLDLPDGFTAASGVAVSWPDGRPRPPAGAAAPGTGGTGGTLTFDIGDLAPGEQVEYRIDGTIGGTPGAADTAVTVITIAGTTAHREPDPVPSNDSDDAVVRIANQTTAPPTPMVLEPPPGSGLSQGLGLPQGPAPALRPMPAAGPPRAARLPRTGAAVLGLTTVALALAGAGTALLAGRRRDTERGRPGATHAAAHR
ncbi:DUF11 domain-containing protein [Xylanimonas allomyrinae]|nr:DUF11 domain-containing protein [Xylanimonas allomyrinae]